MDTTGSFRLTNPGAGFWYIINNGNDILTFGDDIKGARVPFKLAPNANNNLLRIGIVASNRVDIDGTRPGAPICKPVISE